MRKKKRSKARPLLLAAATALTLTMPGCGDDGGTSGNLLAPDCDMYPSYCGHDLSVPDLAPPADLSQNADLGDED